MRGEHQGATRADLLRLFEGTSAAALTDGELLGRFVGRGDAAAFEALVDRLGPLVLGVCRRMLADPHDVDDAFQATFLVLVRRAGSIRDRELVATWLYEVAVRVARRARLDASRRAGRERRAAVGEIQVDEARTERSELRAQIDEEIGRLPEHHRRPVVLCDVEGLSREEAAARLGWSVNMVRGRLDRARGHLRDRLARRGLAPSGTGMALAAPIPPRAALVAATARAAVGPSARAGLASASALSLSRGVIRMLILSRWKLVGSAVLSAGAVAAAVVGSAAGSRPTGAQAPAKVAGRGEQGVVEAAKAANRRLPDVADPPRAVGKAMIHAAPDGPRPSMDGAPGSVPVRVAGLVRDLDGRPVAGASVFLVGTHLLDVPRLTINDAVAGTATTGADGRYLFAAAPIPTSRMRQTPQAATPYVQFRVIARAPGFGVGWHEGASMYAVPLPDPDDIQGRLGLNAPATMDVYLRPEAALRGRVVDEAGRPVAGVKVEVMDVDLLDERGRETSVFLSLRLDTLAGDFGRAVTDADGRFALPGLPSESCCWMSFERPGSKNQRALYASTSARAETVHPDPPLAQHNGRGRHAVFPADMTVAMPTPRRLDVRVVASDDGKPVPGVHVHSMGETLATGTTSGGTTDAEGKVALDLPVGTYRGLYADPDVASTSRFIRTILRPLVVAPEPAVQPLTFTMNAGAEVFIEVVDAETGRGIPDIRFDIKPGIRGDEWERLQRSTSYHDASGVPTNAEGKVRAVLEPKPGAAYRVRIVGVAPTEPRADPFVPGLPHEILPYTVDQPETAPFEPRAGKPATLRFVLKKRARD